jgi:hypothetical protein
MTGSPPPRAERCSSSGLMAVAGGGGGGWWRWLVAVASEPAAVIVRGRLSGGLGAAFDELFALNVKVPYFLTASVAG